MITREEVNGPLPNDAAAKPDFINDDSFKASMGNAGLAAIVDDAYQVILEGQAAHLDRVDGVSKRTPAAEIDVALTALWSSRT